MDKYPAARYPINQSGHGKEAVEAAKKAAEEKKEEKKDEKKEEKAEDKKEDGDEGKAKYPIKGIGKKVQTEEEKKAWEEIMDKYPAARYPINQSGHGKEAVEAAKKAAEEKKEEKKDEKKEGKDEEKKEESLLQLDIYENPYSHYVGNVGSRS